MNILIVGNGFDLSHYLPTKYDHFMDVMEAIESKETGGLPLNFEDKNLEEWLKSLNSIFEKRKALDQPMYEMNFEDLFSKCRDSRFIAKTREYYDVQNIVLTPKMVIEIQYRLAKNCWYQYFKDHVKEIKTWIDFEQKIESVLIAHAECILDLDRISDSEKIYKYFEINNLEDNKIKKINEKILNFFKFIIIEVMDKKTSLTSNGMVLHSSTGNPTKRKNINPIFCHGGELKNGFSPALFLDFLYLQLDQFIEIFNLYLDLIVSQLASKSQVDIQSENWVSPDKIFSFNYTNTYQRIHDSLPVEYLHGSHGEFQNIVLGVSEIEDESLQKLKAYGFTKYHQKLFKGTDYLFLDDYKATINSIRKEIKFLEQQVLAPMGERYIRVLHEQLKNKEASQSLDLNFFIWGHSLDGSDKDYIKDLFSLNDEMDRNVRVTVYYFDSNAKFSLLNNLLAILGKDKVELWMKKGWLKLEENPKINFGI